MRMRTIRIRGEVGLPLLQICTTGYIGRGLSLNPEALNDDQKTKLVNPEIVRPFGHCGILFNR